MAAQYEAAWYTQALSDSGMTLGDWLESKDGAGWEVVTACYEKLPNKSEWIEGEPTTAETPKAMCFIFKKNI